MKKLSFLSGVILIITAFLFGGCYTQLEMQRNASGNYGYNNEGDQTNGNYQTPARKNLPAVHRHAALQGQEHPHHRHGRPF